MYAGKSRQAKSLTARVEDELSDTVLFYYSMTVISIIESFRINGYVELIHQRSGFGGLYQYIVIVMLTEIIQRNAIMWEVIYKCILKKENPARTRFNAIYYGARYQGEFIPIWCMALINLFNEGPYKECDFVRDQTLSDNINIGDSWWLVPVLLTKEAVVCLLAELLLRIARYFKWYGIKNEEGEDPPRKTILVRVNLIPMIWILVECYILSYEAFVWDNDNRNRTPASV